MDPSQQITTILINIREGRAGATEELIPIVYNDLRRLAAYYLRNEPAGQTLQPTAMINELYLRLFAVEPLHWQNRAHFFAVAAQQLRRILVDHARAVRAQKRGGGQLHVSLSNIGTTASQTDEDILAVHEALEALEKLDRRAAQVVELRFFGGLQEREAAEVLGISVASLKRDWEFARAWLLTQLRPVKPR